MADFTSGGWSLFITIVTIVSLIALFFLAWKLSARRTDSGPVETSGHVWDEDLEEYNNPLPRWWLNMFYLTIIWAGLYLIAYPGLGTYKGMLGWTQQGQYDAEMAAAEAKYAPLFDKFAGADLAQVAQDPEAQKIGGRLFSTYCTTCHGSDAGGARGFRICATATGCTVASRRWSRRRFSTAARARCRPGVRSSAPTA